MSDLNQPIGNVEMRLWMQKIDTVTDATHIQATKTNGTVKWLIKMMYLAIGALAILAPISGWLCTSVIADERQISSLKATVSPNAITSAVNSGIEQALAGYDVRK